MGNVSCRNAAADSKIRQMEQEREEGQALLRRMVVSSSEVDWAAVIAKANELHAKEQAWLQSKNRRQRLKLQKRALQKRKRHDSIGSFSVNMLTFRSSDSKGAVPTNTQGSVGNTSHDDQSYGSGLSADGWRMSRSLDEGMEPIVEDFPTVYSVP